MTPHEREVRRLSNARYRKNNRERVLQIERRSRLKHKDAALARSRAFRSTEHGRRLSRNARLGREFGISIEDYEALLASQDGLCAICHRPETRQMFGRTSHMTVDHDHETGLIRALLCHGCNASIGLLEESPDRCRAAAAYLERFNRRQQDGR